MTHPDSPPGSGSGRDGVNLRLLWPQWQGAGTSSVRELASEFPFDVARRGYAVGSAVLEAVLPPHDGPTATVPVTMSDDGLAERDGIEAKTVILAQLARPRGHRPVRPGPWLGRAAERSCASRWLSRVDWYASRPLASVLVIGAAGVWSPSASPRGFRHGGRLRERAGAPDWTPRELRHTFVSL
jgi:hypothetical protein